MSGLTFDQIEDRRAALGVPVTRLTRVAGVTYNYYIDGRASRTRQGAAVLAALDLALKRIAANRDCDASERSRLIDLVLRALDALVAETLDTDAGRDALFGPDGAPAANRRAALIRRTVMGLANSGLGIAPAHLAAAEGVSRAAMTYRLRDHEDARDRAEFDALMDRIETRLRGDA